MNSSATHPSYPYPTIVEALCELYFQLSEEHPWRPSPPGEFFKAVQSDFPEMEPATEMGVRLQVGQSGMSQTFLPPRQRMRYKHAQRPLLLQLTENIFTVNVLTPYPGWETMCHDVLDAWGQAMEVLKALAVTRIGLRYINRIERKTTDDRPGDWLNANEYIAPGVLQSMPGFLSRVEVHLDAHNRIIITLGDQPSSSESPYGAIVFDMDRIIERELPPDRDALAPEMERLHDNIWEAFASAKTERLERLLREGQP